MWKLLNKAIPPSCGKNLGHLIVMMRSTKLILSAKQKWQGQLQSHTMDLGLIYSCAQSMQQANMEVPESLGITIMHTLNSLDYVVLESIAI